MNAPVKQSKQTTLDDLAELSRKETVAVKSVRRKQIVLTEIDTLLGEDELALKIGFKLLPSKKAFSKITTDLFFDGKKISSIIISVPQSPLAKDDFEFTHALDMRGVGSGSHRIKAEMYELWSGEKLTCAFQEVVVKYAPKTREERLIEVPIIKSIAGIDLAIVSDSEKNIYRKIEKNRKKELVGKRDEW